MRNSSTLIVPFYNGTGADTQGRTLADILSWSDSRLESAHDYIQWLFPLPERSNFNPDAPLLTPDSIAALTTSSEAQSHFAQAFMRMLRFYGLEYQEGASGAARVVLAGNYTARSSNWLTPYNHNYLRLTRMLRSLHVLGQQRRARALGDCLYQIYEQERKSGRNRVSVETLKYWQQATDDPS